MRILIVQRSLRPPGGGNAVAAWMVHALAGQHEVATVTTSEWSPVETNGFYGTSIPADIERHVIGAPWRWLSGLSEDHLTRLRLCSVLRAARSAASRFDLLVTADNYAAFAKPGVQYVHFPARLDPRPSRFKAATTMYFRLCDRVLGAPWTDAARNVTLANSQWTARGLEQLAEVSKPIVLYPPVVDPGEGLPWEERDEVFLCIGRFHGSKRIEVAISILEKYRRHDARLIIVGSPVDPGYTARIRRLAAQKNWIEFREDLSRTELNDLMGRSKFGIQAMESEHFGMATAEMTRAGCLVFAHRSGGSPEVLNNEDALLWTTPREASEKMKRLGDVDSLRARLRTHAQTFSTERFVERFRQIVATSAGGNPDR